MTMSTEDQVARRPSDGAHPGRTRRTPHTPPLTFARYSRPHELHPERNEDTVLIDQARGLAAVFDGVGSGHGRLASRLAARVIRRSWQAALAEPGLLHHDLDMGELLRRLMLEAHEQIIAAGEELASEAAGKTAHPGTTAALAVFSKQNPDHHGYILSYAHAGDSRIYLARPHEPLRRLTVDDGYLALKMSEGLLTENDIARIDQARFPHELNATELAYFMRRNGITQALGGRKRPLAIHIDSLSIFPGDRVLLCSDGIHDNLTDSELADLLRREARTTVAKKIVLQAVACSHQQHNALRAKLDDMTAIVVTCHF